VAEFPSFEFANSNHPAAEPQAPAGPPVATGEPVPEPLFDGKTRPKGAPAESLPPKIRELRENDATRKMFDPKLAFQGIGIEEFLESAPGMSIAEKSTAAAEFREMFQDLGMSDPEARGFVSLLRQYSASPPEAATRSQWESQAYKRLVELNGQKGAAEAIELARFLVKRDPRIGLLLEESQLGSHPEIVEQMVRWARRERVQGRI
jgi:hypothetical protein